MEEAAKEREVDSEGHLKKTKSCNLTNGIRSTLKVIQDMEDERMKSKVSKYEVEIDKLLEENQQLRKRLEDCSHPHTASIVRRALKLHNYIAEKCSNPLIADNEGPWEIVDLFTKQARAYIRMAEKNEVAASRLKSVKGKFMEYVEKEVNELTKGWNMMEEEKEKLCKKRVKEEHHLETKSKLEREISELGRKKEELSEYVNQLLVDEKELKRKVEVNEKRLATLKKNISDFLADEYKVEGESQCGSAFERTLSTKKRPLKEWGNDTFEHEKKQCKENKNGRKGRNRVEAKNPKLSKSIEVN